MAFFVDGTQVGSYPMTPGYSSPSYQVPPGHHMLIVAAEPVGLAWPPERSFPPIAIDVASGQTTEALVRCGVTR